MLLISLMQPTRNCFPFIKSWFRSLSFCDYGAKAGGKFFFLFSSAVGSSLSSVSSMLQLSNSTSPTEGTINDYHMSLDIKVF